MTAVTIAEYDFDTDVVGLGDFINQQMAQVSDDELIVDLSDDEGRIATHARFERETLSDGSTVVNLIIYFC